MGNSDVLPHIASNVSRANGRVHVSHNALDADICKKRSVKYVRPLFSNFGLEVLIEYAVLTEKTK